MSDCLHLIRRYKLRMTSMSKERINRTGSSIESLVGQPSKVEGLHPFLEALGCGALLVNGSGSILAWNRALVDQTGLTPTPGATLEGLPTKEPWITAATLAKRSPSLAAGSPETHGHEARWQGIDERATCQLEDGRRFNLYAASIGDTDTVLLSLWDLSAHLPHSQSLERSTQIANLASLLSGITHEVRNPLFGISATLDAFEARFGPAGDHGRYLEVLRQQVERLIQLMAELFELGRPTTLAAVPEPLEETFAEVIAGCLREAENSGIALRSDLDPALPPLIMDRPRLTSVFQNLVDNAIQHSTAGDPVTLRVTPNERAGSEWIHCTIEDRGPGFREEDLPRAFEPFFTQRQGGTGLGLAISRRVVEDHGGEISLQNRAGGGARIHVWLPAAAQPSMEIRPGNTESASS